MGGKTCKCTTVVDYVILSPSLFHYISEFEVLPFDPMISDAHSGLLIDKIDALNADQVSGKAIEELTS